MAADICIATAIARLTNKLKWLKPCKKAWAEFDFLMKVTMDLFNVALQAIHAPIYIKYGGAVDTTVEVKWRDVLILVMKDMSDY